MIIKHGHGQIIGPDENDEELAEKIGVKHREFTQKDAMELARENEWADDGRNVSGRSPS